MITLENLGKSFNGRIVFTNVTCTVERGSILVLLGSSGIGKSTLLKIAAGLLPFTGSVTIDGQHIDPDEPKPSQKTAYVSQAPSLWQHLTAQQNVSLVRRMLLGEDRRSADKQALEWLAKFDAEDHAKRYPSTLSGGEQQRVSLARGFATERPVLLLDEITSNVDAVRRATIINVVKEQLHRGTTIILATHDTETAWSFTSLPCRLELNGLTPLNRVE